MTSIPYAAVDRATAYPTSESISNGAQRWYEERSRRIYGYPSPRRLDSALSGARLIPSAIKILVMVLFWSRLSTRKCLTCAAAALLAMVGIERRCSTTLFPIPAWHGEFVPTQVDSEIFTVFSSCGFDGSPPWFLYGMHTLESETPSISPRDVVGLTGKSRKAVELDRDFCTGRRHREWISSFRCMVSLIGV
jgi:hypothetical protein